jgi:hypothetical protein
MRNEHQLVLSMAGKILAPIASSANYPSVVSKARDILAEVDKQISQITNQVQVGFLAQTRNSVAEVAATIVGAQLTKSGSAAVSSDPKNDKNVVEWAIKLAINVYESA